MAGADLNPWNTTTSLPNPTDGLTTISYDSYIYAVGGSTGAATATVDYAPINANGTLGSWTATTSLPAATQAATSVVYNGYIYEIGGYTTAESSVVNYAPINANGTLGSWTATTSLPAATQYATSVVYNGYVYEIGGYTTAETSVVDYAPINANGTLGAWTATTSLPASIEDATSVVYNGYVYEIGGYTTAETSVVDYAPINANGTLGAWSSTASLLAATVDSTSLISNGYVYEIGGYNGTSPLTSVDYAYINSNGALGSWTATSSLTTPTLSASTVFANGYLYEIGGYNSGNLSTVEYTGISPYQLTSRSLTMSNSESIASGLTYHVSVDTGDAGSVQSIIVDFCSNSPVTGVACTAPGGFSVGTSPSVANLLLGGAVDGGGTWTASSANSGRTLIYTRSAPVSLSSGESISFDIDNVSNPSATGTFYSRMMIYDFDQSGYTATSPGAYTQFGGFALSTASTIDLSATVQEEITFCVYQSTCGSPVNVALGHTVGNATVIDSTVVDTQPVDFSLSTNANHGASVSILGSTLTDAAGQTIPAMTTSGSITAGTADFGIYLSSLGSGMSVASPYATSASGYYYGATGTTTNELASSSAPVNNSVSTITYGVTASNNTPSGIYTASHQLIATGTF
ncbi:MAG TPA: hypothetical protein VFN61_03735 [Acidimicrobiales bacterium]|nr:hypothetical protein [Acidimicrobiales bacterium]